MDAEGIIIPRREFMLQLAFFNFRGALFLRSCFYGRVGQLYFYVGFDLIET